MISEKNEKFSRNFSDDERGNLINNKVKQVNNFFQNVNNISSEIRSLQRSLALMKQDLPKILHDELIRLKEGL